jgi:nucleoside-diphosphate-sugar epimerase
LRTDVNTSTSYYITGATGFIGSELKRQLTLMGENVIPIGKVSPEEFATFIDTQKLVGKKCLIFCDWQGVYGNRNDNLIQFENAERWIKLSEVAKKFEFTKILGLGSQAEISSNQVGVKSDVPFEPRNVYGVAKQKAYEGISKSLIASKTNLQWARLFSVYGPTMSSRTFISTVIRHSYAKSSLDLSIGEQKWNFLYVSDCAKALIKILEENGESRIFNVASSKTISLRWVAEFIANKLEARDVLRFGYKPYLEGEVFDMSPNVQDLINLGWQEEVSLEEGLLACIHGLGQELGLNIQ